MPRSGDRGGNETRQRIAALASALFVERGFEDVTVTEIGRAAGVSSVTVFKYFPKKEDLFFDRAEELTDTILEAVKGHRTPTEFLSALRNLLEGFATRRHPLSGLDERSIGFFRSVATSPVLTARARQLVTDLERAIARTLTTAGFTDPELTAAFVVAGYASVLRRTATDLIDQRGEAERDERHTARLQRLMVRLEQSLPENP